VVSAAPGVALFLMTPVVYTYAGADAAIVFASLTPLLSIPFNWRYASKFIKIDHLRESAMAVIAIVAGIILLYAV
jgi:hypothetical protein